MVGHVFNLDFPPEYQNWEKTDCLDLFSAKTIHKEASGGVIRHLRTVGANVYAAGAQLECSDYVVLWLDCDNEGENICFEVLSCVKPVMKNWRGRSGPPL